MRWIYSLLRTQNPLKDSRDWIKYHCRQKHRILPYTALSANSHTTLRLNTDLLVEMVISLLNLKNARARIIRVWKRDRTLSQGLICLLASKILVTPNPVTSPVPIGCSKLAPTKLCAAKWYISSGSEIFTVSTIDPASTKSAGIMFTFSKMSKRW